ncbi:MAG: VOC family protein [Gemmatimonadales bacterium]|nr:VOC family protein [Gemmatimonadales bacterium]
MHYRRSLESVVRSLCLWGMWAFAFSGCSNRAETLPLTLEGAEAAPVIASVALRVHNIEQMQRFYSEAFGVEFRTVPTGPFISSFGEIGNVLLKLVPIRDAEDFVGFPVVQLGVEVPEIDSAIASAIRHGGRLHDSIVVRGDSVVAAVRDPDGNTIELYQVRRGS